MRRESITEREKRLEAVRAASLAQRDIRADASGLIPPIVTYEDCQAAGMIQSVGHGLQHKIGKAVKRSESAKGDPKQAMDHKNS
jgi:hypothetical protein